MKTKTDPKPIVTATTTVSITIQGKTFQMTKEEAQEFAQSLVSAVGLPTKIKIPERSKEEMDAFEKAFKEAQKMRPLAPPVQWPKPYNEGALPWEIPRWPSKPRIIFEVTPKREPGFYQ